MKYARTFTVTNRLDITVSISLVERDGTLVVGVSPADAGGEQSLAPGERLCVAAREVQRRCAKDGRLRFSVDNRTATPVAFIPEEASDIAWDLDDMHYAVADERTLGESR